MGKCSFQQDWLRKKDCNGYIVLEWLRKESDTEAFCTVCKKCVKITKGFQAVEQHASSSKHKEEARTKLISSQLRLCSVRSVEENNVRENVLAGSSSSTHTALYSTRDNASRVELLWLLKCIASDYSASSCDGIRETFTEMFPGSVPADFSLGRTKARYLVADALAPYFREQQLRDVKNAHFSLCYDETTNAAGKKELQTALRYWSHSQCQIVTTHLQTFFIGSATAEDIKQKLDEALLNAALPRKSLLMLGSDGPNVNKKVMRLMNEEMIAERNKPLLNIGTCNIHILHNGYLKGLEELGEDASELIIAVFYFFKGWPSRCEDYEQIQIKLGLPTHQFIKHVSSRWLTMEGASERLIEQWPALIKYFLDFIPKKRSSLVKKGPFLKITKFLKTPTIKAEVLFAASGARIFTKFTGMFQREEPLIHIMFSELETLIRTLAARVCNLEVCSVSVLPNVDTFDKVENLLPIDQMVFETEIMTELLKVKEIERNSFLIRGRKFFIAACKHVIQKSSIYNTFLKQCRCLHPAERKSSRSSKDILEMAKALPIDVKIDVLLDEWNLLRYEKDEQGSEEWRVDSYWNQFFHLKNTSGDSKFPKVSMVVKAALSVSHGNADVERGFSTSARILTDDRASMSERTLNALVTVKSALKQYKNKPHLVPITRELLAMSRSAYSHYKLFLEEEKRKKQEEEKKRLEESEKKEEEERKRKLMDESRMTISEEEKRLKTLRDEEEQKRLTADRLFNEAHLRLKRAIEQKNMKEVELAQAMLEGVKTVRQQHSVQKRAADVVQNSVDKRKSTFITDFFSKKSKL